MAAVVGDRSDQIDALLRNTQTLLAAVNQRSEAISALLVNIAYFGEQVQGLVRDNPTLNLQHVFDEAASITDMLVRRKEDLSEMFTILGRYLTIVNDAVASGPYFKVSTLNLVPFWILQPWVDAAFKKRGISPEEFWRNAGLPEFRYPDPNGTRFANGAPPPAPQVLEGTPEHPGPAVAPGSPCSYAPAAGLFPTPGNPLPCANLDPNEGPFGRSGRTPDRSMSWSRRRTRTACPHRRASPSPAARARRRRWCPVPRCRCPTPTPARGPSRWARSQARPRPTPARPRRPHRGHPARRLRPDPETSYRRRSSPR